MVDQKESIVQKIDRYREEAKKYRKQFEPDFEEAERFYAGYHWKQRDPRKRSKNFIFQLIEGEVPLLMDPMPSTDVIAKDDSQEEQAPILNAAKKHVYEHQNVFMSDTQAVREMLKVGQGFQYIDYDPDGENGEGSVCIKNLTWDQVYLDPAMASDLDSSRYASFDIPVSKDELKRIYPKTWEEALKQPLKDIFKFSSSKTYDENQNTGSYGSSFDTGRYESKDMTHLEETWLKDFSLIDIPDDETQIEITKETAQLQQGINPDVHKWEDHVKHIDGHSDQRVFIAAEMLQIAPEQVTEQDIQALRESDQMAALLFNIIDDHIKMHQMHIESMDADEVGKKPKYKNFWRVVIKTGQVIHYDGEPDVDDGMIPLAIFYCYKGVKAWADGAIKNIIHQQKTINELDEKEFKGLKLVTNPGWVYDAQSKVDGDTLTDEDGIVIEKQQGTEVQRLAPGQVSPQLSARSVREYETMQRIEGVGEAVLGEAPKHVMSGVSMRRLQMQSLGRIRLKSKMIENAILRRDKLILSRIIKYWSTERKLRVEDGNGKYKFVTFSPEAIRDLSYDLILSPGTMAGMDNEAIYETYKELLLAGAIDLKSFLEITNLPKKQVLIDKMAENDQQAAEMQRLVQENLQLKTQFMPEAISDQDVALAQQLGIQ